MKGGLAIMQALMARHRPGEGPFDLIFIFYTREEGPYLESGLIPLFEQQPWLSEIDLAICLEPSDNRLQLGCLGALHAQLIFHGRAAHSARPWQGKNAIHAAGPLLNQLLDRPPRDLWVGDLCYREVISITLASGGQTRNVIPSRFELNLNFRFAPDKDLETAQNEIRALAKGAELRFTDLCPSGPPFANHFLVKRLRAELDLPIESKQAWTDVARLAQYGVPALNFGPGASAQAHQAGEWIDLGALMRGFQLFQRFLRRSDG